MILEGGYTVNLKVCSRLHSLRSSSVEGSKQPLSFNYLVTASPPSFIWPALRIQADWISQPSRRLNLLDRGKGGNTPMALAMDGHWYVGHDFWKKLLTNTIPKPSFDSKYGHAEIIVDGSN